LRLARIIAIGLVAGLGAAVAGCANDQILSVGTSTQDPGASTSAYGGTTSSTETASYRQMINPLNGEVLERPPGAREVIKDPSVAEVMKTGTLPEMSWGKADAPVTVIKYASLTCPYCRKFHLETFPLLKKRYIDTGQMRFILREFPIGFQSGAATIAMRCVPAKHYFDAYGALLKAQARWVSQEVRREPIWQVVRQFGLTRAQFDACYDDKKLVADLNAVKERGRTLGVIGTPNFFIGNKLHKRVLTMTDFDAAMSGAGFAGASASSLPTSGQR
jgi:protein-disulfide isomerase